MTRNPSMFPQIRHRRGNGGKREDLGRYFRSTWEANWARYLKWLKDRGEIKDWEYEVQEFVFDKIKRGSRSYLPDFRILTNAGAIEFHEVKGYMDQKSSTKIRRMAKYFPEVRLTVIGKKEYREVANKLGRLIPNWEMVRGRVSRTD